MRRDLDLVRTLLLMAEDADGPLDLRLVEVGDASVSTLAYHVQLMADAGLVDAKVSVSHGVPQCAELRRLTWAGEDYLDAIRSERVWREVMKAAKESIGEISLAVAKEACIACSLEMVKKALSRG